MPVADIPDEMMNRRDLKTSWICPSELYVDSAYQRGIDRGRVRRMVAAWDEQACGTLTVNVREETGRITVIDGQHRLAAWVMVYGDVRQVPCTVYYGLSPTEEARLFAVLNGQRRPPTRLEVFRAKLAADDPVALDIAAIVGELELEINYGGSAVPGPTSRITAIAACESVYARSGATGLRAVLALIRDTWVDERLAYSSRIVTGLHRFLMQYEQQYDRDLFVRKLASVQPSAIIRRAQVLKEATTSTSPWAIAAALRAQYNHGLRLRQLPELTAYHGRRLNDRLGEDRRDDEVR